MLSNQSTEAYFDYSSRAISVPASLYGDFLNYTQSLNNSCLTNETDGLIYCDNCNSSSDCNFPDLKINFTTNNGTNQTLIMNSTFYVEKNETSGVCKVLIKKS